MATRRRGDRAIHALVVDDSAVFRQVMISLLTNEAGMEVTTAADPLIAMRKMESVRPDVIVLDLEMPRMDGLTFLRKIMRENPMPVVVCSGAAESGAQLTMKALQEGAVDIIAKPKLRMGEDLSDSALALVESVRAAAHARVDRVKRIQSGRIAFQRRPRVSAGRGPNVIAIGASTGGTEALSLILEQMPSNSPPIVIVQHMPARFTGAFARRLDQAVPLNVREARDGDSLETGLALIAPGDQHVSVVRHGPNQYIVRLDEGPLVNRHRPSVDVLFNSVASAAGSGAVGVLLTGMGKDGAEGLLAMKNAGALTIAQNRETSVVFGMPKVAIDLGAVLRVVPVERIALELVSTFETGVAAE